MRVEASIPVKVGAGVLPLSQEKHDEMVAEMWAFAQNWLHISANNRLKKSDTKGSFYWDRASELVIWELTENALVAYIDVGDGTQEDQNQALATVHWLELGWAACWTQHAYETLFARPFSSLDVTVTMDPVEVVKATTNAIAPDPTSGLCGCRFCAWCRPRVVKWGVKRKGLAELYRRLGEGESVTAGEILPLVGSDKVKASGRKAPKKTEVLTADEAKDWLALNPGRAF